MAAMTRAHPQLPTPELPPAALELLAAQPAVTARSQAMREVAAQPPEATARPPEAPARAGIQTPPAVPHRAAQRARPAIRARMAPRHAATTAGFCARARRGMRIGCFS